MKFIVGKKIGMSRMYNEGKSEAVTLVSVFDCFVSQLKDKQKDDHQAVQIAFNLAKKKDGRKSGSLKKAGIKDNFGSFSEFRILDLTKYKLNDKIVISQFKKDDIIKVSGISKGKGFAGVMKRHGFHGSPHSHGHKHDWRAPGSINSGHPQHVMKGRRMGGRMGSDKVTLENLKVLDVNVVDNILAIKGAVPGRVGTLLKIQA